MQGDDPAAAAGPLWQFLCKKIFGTDLFCPHAEGNRTHMITPDIPSVKISYATARKLSAQKTKGQSLLTGAPRDAAVSAVRRFPRLIRSTTGAGIVLFQMPVADGTDHPADANHFRGK